MPIHTAIESAPGGVLFAVDANGNEFSDALHTRSDAPWVWVHLAQKSPEARQWMLRESEIPVAHARAMLEDKIRPRCEITDQGILFIGRGVNLDPASVPGGRGFAPRLGGARTHHHRGRAPAPLRGERRGTIREQRQTPGVPGEVLATLFSQMVNRITPVVQEISDRLDEIQETVIDDRIPVADIAELAPVRLRAVTLHRYMTPMLDTANALISAPQIREHASVVEELMITRDRLVRVVEDLSAIDSRAAVTRDEMVSRRADQLNERVYNLTVLAAIFLPLTVLTGLFGMNVGGVPLMDNALGFLITCLGLTAIMVVTILILKKLHWI